MIPGIAIAAAAVFVAMRSRQPMGTAAAKARGTTMADKARVTGSSALANAIAARKAAATTPGQASADAAIGGANAPWYGSDETRGKVGSAVGGTIGSLVGAGSTGAQVGEWVGENADNAVKAGKAVINKLEDWF